MRSGNTKSSALSTESKVIEIVAQTLELSGDDIAPKDRFVEDLGATSLDLVNLIWRTEEVFSLSNIPVSMAEHIETVRALAACVGRARSADFSEGSVMSTIAIAADHAGVQLKDTLLDWLDARGQITVDLGPADDASVDYPDFAERAAQRVADGQAQRAVLICGSGIGMSIAANKVAGVRAAAVTDPLSASLARRHNDANILCLGARIIGRDMAKACIDAFLDTEFDPGEDGRHQRRVDRIGDIGRRAHE